MTKPPEKSNAAKRIACSKQEIEFNLLFFATLVEEGRTPPAWLLQFMAEGARAMLKDGKPWPTKNGRKSRLENNRAVMLQAYALSAAGFTRHRIAELLGMLRENGGDHEKTLRRYIKEGERIIYGKTACALDPQPGGEYLYREALRQLASIGSLSESERQLIEHRLACVQTYIDEWAIKECGIGPVPELVFGGQ